MDGRHPDLIGAEKALDEGDAKPIVQLAFRSRLRMEEGTYCECPDPIIPSEALMCERCLCRNRNQEVAAVHRIVDAHEFVPGDKLDGLMCNQCTMWPWSPRHHGQPAIGRTSWGLSVAGITTSDPTT